MSIDITENQDLLIEQWKLAPRFNALLDGLTSLMQSQLVDPICFIGDQRIIEGAEGVFLDHIGQRLGLPRGFDVEARPVGADEFFGFDGDREQV